MPAQSPLKTVKKFYPDVTKVVDAPQGLAVTVGWEDVEEAIRRDPQHCAVANACERSLHLDGALISKSVAYLVKGRVATRYIIPNVISKQIAEFDSLGDFMEQTFKFYAPGPTQQLGQRRHDHSMRKHPKRRKPLVALNGLRQRLTKTKP